MLDKTTTRFSHVKPGDTPSPAAFGTVDAEPACAIPAPTPWK